MTATSAYESVGTTRVAVGARTDEDLVDAVRAGDDRAFECLYERYHRRVAYYVFGMVHDYGRAEDISQEVFMSALRRMRQTDRPIAFKPWVYEIAKNACIDQFRRSQRRNEVSFDGDDTVRLPHLAPAPDLAVEQKASLDNLCGAFNGLSEVHHRVLVMRELEGLSYDEIGARLDMTRPAVESTLFRARRRLAEEYEELVTGERCLRVQAIVDNAAEGVLGARDRRRLAAHVSHCQACRRHAFAGGLDVAALTGRGKVAALLPFPLLLRRREAPVPPGSTHSSAMLQWAGQMSTVDPSVAGWARAAVAAVTVAVAGVGAGTQGSHITSALLGKEQAPKAAIAAAPASHHRAHNPLRRYRVSVRRGGTADFTWDDTRLPSASKAAAAHEGGAAKPPTTPAAPIVVNAASRVPLVARPPKVPLSAAETLEPITDATKHPVRQAVESVTSTAQAEADKVAQDGKDVVEAVKGILGGK